ncbi:hypothetical protein D910_10438, partial [Dendroctonus ponderosae]
MHRECFDQWEQAVLSYLKTCGRARSWSERQRHQNLWTKKGYDLAYKACGCNSGSSSPPASGSEPSVSPVHGAYSKKKSKVDLPDRI